MQDSIVEISNSDIEFVDAQMYVHHRLVHTCSRCSSFCFWLAMSMPHDKENGLTEDSRTQYADVRKSDCVMITACLLFSVGAKVL